MSTTTPSPTNTDDTNTNNTTDNTNEEPVWRQAGRAWGHAAVDWAYLFEPYARDAVETAMTRAQVGPGVDLLDVACGSGLAMARAERLGATVAGIDAAEALVDIARRRAPTAEIMAGDMFDLPWADDSFSVITSFNGIGGGCDAAVAEMARVLRPDGTIIITFWGDPKRLGLRDYFLALGGARVEVAEELIELASIGAPGVAEAMFGAAGLRIVEQGSTTARLEFADDDVAWRALRSPGVALPALDAIGEDEMRRRVLDAINPFRAGDGSYQIDNELTHLVATTA